MILIITSKDDQTTNEVIDWLTYWNQSFLRINPDQLIKYNKVNILSDGTVDISFTYKGTNYNVSEFKNVWYRRGYIITTYANNLYVNDQMINEKINQQLKIEGETINNFFTEIINERSINNPEDGDLNKLHVLRMAHQVGLIIPNTIITISKKDVIEFYVYSNNEG